MISPLTDNPLAPETTAFLDDLYRHLQSCSSVVEVRALLDERLPPFLSGFPEAAPQKPVNTSVGKSVIDEREYKPLIGTSGGLREVMNMVHAVAPGDTTVLITGETGTGKELIARAIHEQSARSKKVMVRINCAAIPAGTIESELFGHEAGSFTGAVNKHQGSFERAHGGTLFLDEIGELTAGAQAKLLRVIQEKEIERIGGRQPVPTDVRLVCATARDLAAAVHAGTFRADLYYRLYVFPIVVPPLRERKDDILPLANYFLQVFCVKTGKPVKRLSATATRQLLAHDWPGNVRELEHVIERSVLLSSGNIVQEASLPRPVADELYGIQSELPTLSGHERAYIVRVLQACRGKVRGTGGAANVLGIPPTTLHSKMKKLGISKQAK